MREIAEDFKLPDSLDKYWANRGYYGSIYHDVAATYVLYLGWFDGNPSTLHELPPVEASKKYVEFMGGADAVMEKAKQSYEKGEYRWVAEVMNHVVFADPDNQAAKNLDGGRARTVGLPGRIRSVAQFLSQRRAGTAQRCGGAADAEHRKPRHGACDVARPVLRLSRRAHQSREGGRCPYHPQLRLRREGRQVSGRTRERRAQQHRGRAGRQCRRHHHARRATC